MSEINLLDIFDITEDDIKGFAKDYAEDCIDYESIIKPINCIFDRMSKKKGKEKEIYYKVMLFFIYKGLNDFILNYIEILSVDKDYLN